ASADRITAMNASHDSRSAASPHGDRAAGTDPAGGDAEHATPRRTRRQRKPLWLDTLVTLEVALLIAGLDKSLLRHPCYIPPTPLNPTLLENDKILVSKLSPGVFDLQRGDVIVFEDPDVWIAGDATENPTVRVRVMMLLSLVGLAPDPSQDHLVKRLIGVSGD